MRFHSVTVLWMLGGEEDIKGYLHEHCSCIEIIIRLFFIITFVFFYIYFHGVKVTFLYCNFYKITFYWYLNLSAEGLSLVLSRFTVITLKSEVAHSDCKTSLTHSEAFPSVACNKRLVNATFLSVLQQPGVRIIRMSQVGQSLLHPAAHTHISKCHHVILYVNSSPTIGKSVRNTSLAM